MNKMRQGVSNRLGMLTNIWVDGRSDGCQEWRRRAPHGPIEQAKPVHQLDDCGQKLRHVAICGCDLLLGGKGIDLRSRSFSKRRQTMRICNFVSLRALQWPGSKWLHGKLPEWQRSDPGLVGRLPGLTGAHVSLVHVGPGVGCLTSFAWMMRVLC